MSNEEKIKNSFSRSIRDASYLGRSQQSFALTRSFEWRMTECVNTANGRTFHHPVAGQKTSTSENASVLSIPRRSAICMAVGCCCGASKPCYVPPDLDDSLNARNLITEVVHPRAKRKVKVRSRILCTSCFFVLCLLLFVQKTHVQSDAMSDRESVSQSTSRLLYPGRTATSRLVVLRRHTREVDVCRSNILRYAIEVRILLSKNTICDINTADQSRSRNKHEIVFENFRSVSSR
jgi:hypothetical protein